MDMLVNLYTLPECTLPEGVRVCRALPPESGLIRDWIGSHFGKGWRSEALPALAQQPPTCFVAQREGKIIGFACYDATAKGYFGPIGVAEEELGFRGLILSDAIEMKAILNLYGIADGTLRALNAGVDIAFICHSAQQVIEAMDCLEAACADGRLAEENVEAGYRRVIGRKAGLPAQDDGVGRFGTPDQQADAERIMEAGIRLLHAPDGRPLPKLGAETVIFGTKARRNAIANDDIELDAARTFADAFGGRYAGQAPDAAPETAVVFIGRHSDADVTVSAARHLAE